MQLLDVLVCNSANKQTFQNLTKSYFVQRSIDGKNAMPFFTMSLHFFHLGSIGQKGIFWIFKRWAISQIKGQNVQKLPIFAIFAS